MASAPQLSILRGSVWNYKLDKNSNLLATIASDTSDNISLIYNDKNEMRKHTFKELNEISTTFSHIIKDKITNILPNEDGDYIVAINLHPSDVLVGILLGIWKAGAAYLPLDPDFPTQRLEYIINDAKPALIICEEDSKHYLRTERLFLDDLLNGINKSCVSQKMKWDLTKNVSKKLAIVMYTSGSTGSPKGVKLTHDSIINRLLWQFRTFSYGKNEMVCVFKTALTFVDSVCEIWGPLMNGLSLLVIPKEVTKNTEQLVGMLERYKVKRLVLVPSLLKSILMYLQQVESKSLLMDLKTWICSGETLSISLVTEFFNAFAGKQCELCNFYGSTEIMGDVTYFRMTSLNQLSGLVNVPIGIPVDNNIVYLLDEHLQPVLCGQIGQIFVAGLNVALGYVNGRDSDKFLKNLFTIDPAFNKMYNTGDFGSINNGLLMYEGRKDSQIKVRGHRVDLLEVEKIINLTKYVEKAIVLCYKHGEINQVLLAFIKCNGNITENQLEFELKNKLMSYMVPQVILIDDFPLLVNGKIDRQALLRMFESSNNNDDDFFQININYEGIAQHKIKDAQILFEIIASALGRLTRSTISKHANFYEIGGNSLNSMVVISNLRDQQYYISITDFIASIDLGEVLERITRKPIVNTDEPFSYLAEPLITEHKEVVTRIITKSFYEKADLEQWILADLHENDYEEFMEKLWNSLVEKNLSFVVKDENQKIIATALNFDARDEPEIVIESKLSIILDFLEFVEAPIRDKQLPPGKGSVLHSFVMGTHSSLSPKENIIVIKFMEEEILRIAKSRGFLGIFTTNSSPLTQQLGTHEFNYQTMLDYQINQYISEENTQPFKLAPDTARVLVQWKPLLDV